MENLLKQNLDVLKEVSGMITAETSCNIIICDSSGEIIEATQTERIGRKHMGAIKIMSGEADEAAITPAQETYYRGLGADTDTRAGYNYLIAIEGKRVGSLGVAGDPEYLKPIVRIAAKTISTYINECIKEKRKNSILQKLARIAEEIREQPYGGIDYQIFTDDLRIISGAKFVLLNLYDLDEDSASLVSVSGSGADLEQALAIYGQPIAGVKWSIDTNFKQQVHQYKHLCAGEFADLWPEYPPAQWALALKQPLCLGGLYILEIAHLGEIIGDLLFLMPEDESIQNKILVELYAAQIGQLLMRFRAEADLQKSQQELNQALTILDSFWYYSPNPILILDIQGNVVKASRYISDLFGCAPDGLTGRNVVDLFDEAEAQKLTGLLQEVSASRETIMVPGYSVNFEFGEKRYFDNWIFPITDQQQSTPLLGVVGLDMTARIKTEQTLEYLSMHDHLTGVYNRTFFDKAIDRLGGSDQFPISIITLDADCLKIINDTMGHHYGDESLRNLSAVLSTTIRDTDVLARIGGDEFVIIMPGAGREQAQGMIAKIRQNIDLFNYGKQEMPLSISVGCATAATPDDCLHETLAKADEQMYHNKLFYKENNRNRIIDALLRTLSEKDCITHSSSVHLPDLCVKVGQKKRLSAKSLSALALLAKVHDLGKVCIADDILLKPGPLDEKEWEIIRQHPEKGYRIAIVSPELYNIADLILKHHERWDGGGYPLGLRGKDIPVECRILAVAYSYDAMITGRPYSRAYSQEEAIQELLRCSGSQFDPEIVDLFVMIIRDEHEQYSLF